MTYDVVGCNVLFERVFTCKLRDRRKEENRTGPRPIARPLPRLTTSRAPSRMIKKQLVNLLANEEGRKR
jgi:hypothetical protein